MGATITEEDRRRIELRIDKWRSEFEAYRLASNVAPASQVSNWLFGMQVALLMLGLNDLAKLAGDAQEVDQTEASK